LLVALLLISCSIFEPVDKTDSQTDESTANPFFAYNFGGLEDLPPAEQVKLLKDNGYDGITLRMAKAEHVDEFLEFDKIVNATPNFKIYSVFVRYNFADSQVDKNRWKAVVDLIENKGIDLWFIFGKPEPGVDDEHVEAILRNVVSYAATKKVPVTLYPHSWCYFETSEDCLPMVKKINDPNLKMALLTCHELKAGNGDRLVEVVNKVKDHISFMVISGASQEVDITSRKSMDATTIQPLEDGEYDFSNFLKTLAKANFKGPVGYINFKFNKAPETYLPESIKEWNRLKTQYLN
jgi:sugar phosphate isomerase/epimerase